MHYSSYDYLYDPKNNFVRGYVNGLTDVKKEKEKALRDAFEWVRWAYDIFLFYLKRGEFELATRRWSRFCYALGYLTACIDFLENEGN